MSNMCAEIVIWIVTSLHCCEVGEIYLRIFSLLNTAPLLKGNHFGVTNLAVSMGNTLDGA